MKLHVSWSTASRGVSEYTVEPDDEDSHGRHKPRDVKRLQELLPRIRKMARRQLGKALVSVEPLEPFILINVKVGTSKGDLKFVLRSFLGWVELFDAEKA